MKKKREINWWRIVFGEEEKQLISRAINNECISQGLVTAEFERKIGQVLGMPYVVATTSGSTAMLMALIAAGIKPGDEVIVPNRTWIATAHAPALLGAKVVFVDVEKYCPLIDVDKIGEKITKRTKVIMPVHLNGRSADMRAINIVASKYGLIVIEDAAQAFCSKNRDGLLGTQSFAGCFSLSIAKIISTGQGGFIVTKNKKVYDRLKLIRTHGVYDLINVSYSQYGFNFRFNDILASIGIAQIAKLSEHIKNVKNIYKIYESAIQKLPFLKFIPVNISAGEIPIYIEVLCKKRNGLIKFLADYNIQTRPFYPNLDSAKYLLSNGQKFPNSKIFENQGLFLPCGPGQPLDNIDRVIEILKKYQ